MMRHKLEELDGVLIYLDDILITEETRSEQDQLLERVLDRIPAGGLTINNQCVPEVQQIDLIGYTAEL